VKASEADALLARLRLDLKGLEAEQGRIARRNARKKVLTALRTLRATLDDRYPVIRESAAQRRKGLRSKKLGPKGRASLISRRLRAAGYEPINKGIWTVEQLAFEKIPIKRGPQGGAWAPVWAVFAKGSTELIAAKRDRELRLFIDARARLS
jgi:hypothetical protein